MLVRVSLCIHHTKICISNIQSYFYSPMIWYLSLVADRLKIVHVTENYTFLWDKNFVVYQSLSLQSSIQYFSFFVCMLIWKQSKSDPPPSKFNPFNRALYLKLFGENTCGFFFENRIYQTSDRIIEYSVTVMELCSLVYRVGESKEFGLTLTQKSLSSHHKQE